MPLYKYVGFMLTYEQVAIIASNLAKKLKDFTDLDKTVNIMNSFSVVDFTLRERFPKCVMWPTICPRGSLKDEDARLLLVCHAYDHPHETSESYAKIPATKRDVKILAWLKRNGMDAHEMLKQWMTLPNPQDDDPKCRLIRDGDY